MPESERYPIKEAWEKYYITLEAIRRIGVVNMWGASPVLQECFPRLSDKTAQEILCNWIHNYDELNRKYSWQ